MHFYAYVTTRGVEICVSINQKVCGRNSNILGGVKLQINIC